MTPTTRHLIAIVAEVYGLDPDLITSGARFGEVISPRHAVWLIHAERTQSISATAREFGVDHSAITHARKRMQAMCDTDPREAQLWAEAQLQAAKRARKRGVDPAAFRCALEKVDRAMRELQQLIHGDNQQEGKAA